MTKGYTAQARYDQDQMGDIFKPMEGCLGMCATMHQINTDIYNMQESGQFISLSLLTKFKQDANPIQIVFDIQLMRKHILRDRHALWLRILHVVCEFEWKVADSLNCKISEYDAS